jgi:hypothetical protein
MKHGRWRAASWPSSLLEYLFSGSDSPASRYRNLFIYNYLVKCWGYLKIFRKELKIAKSEM